MIAMRLQWDFYRSAAAMCLMTLSGSQVESTTRDYYWIAVGLLWGWHVIALRRCNRHELNDDEWRAPWDNPNPNTYPNPNSNPSPKSNTNPVSSIY